MRSLRAWALGLSLSIASFARSPAAADQKGDASIPDPAAAERRAQLLVKGDGFSISVGMLEDHINKQPPSLRARFRAPEEKKALLDSLVRLELLGRVAASRGLGSSAAVRQTVKDGAVQTLVRTEIDDKVTAESIGKEEIDAYYAAHPEEFHYPAQRRASHIALDTREHALPILVEAKKADSRAFAELAKKHSLDAETKLRGGDLAFFTREPARDRSLRPVPEPLRQAVFALKAIGDTADEPVAVDGQFSIVRWTGERPERHVTREEAESSVRARLWRERRKAAVEQLIARLRSQEKPQVFSERIDLVKFDDMDKRPGGFMPDPARRVPGGAKQDKATRP